MKQVVLLLFLLLLTAEAGLSQQVPVQDPLQDLRAELRELNDSLRGTQQELGQARAEIRALREELTHLRQSNAQPAEQATTDRIATLEEAQQLLEARVEQHDQTKVETASKFKLKLDGMVLFNAGSTRGEVDSIDVPNLALQPVGGKPAGSIFGTLRQTLLGLQIIGPKIGGAKTSAELQFDFFGGFPSELDSTSMGLVRMRVAQAEFRWDKWALHFGQDQPFFSPLSPSSLASLGIPSFGLSGNLWTWTPQIVGERLWSVGQQTSTKLEFGVLDPFDGETPSGFERSPEAGERSRRPAFAVRQSWKHGSGSTPLEVGAGAYVAKQDYGFGRAVTAWAGTLDWNIPFPAKLSLSGEFFRGRALGGMWGGIGQSVSFSGRPSLPPSIVRPVNTIGGWSQLKYAPSTKVEFNGGFGMDNPFAGDLRFGAGSEYPALFQNRTTMVNVIEHLRSNVLISLEYRHLRTALASRSQTAEHVNLGVGVQF